MAVKEEGVAAILLAAVSLAVAVHRLLIGPLFDIAFEVLVIYLPATMAIANCVGKRLGHGAKNAKRLLEGKH